MERLGILTGADLRDWSLPALEAHFGSSADWYWRICRGIDEREVKPDRPYKSVSAERTFDEDLRDPDRLAAELERIAGYAWDRVERAEVAGRTVTLKVKFGDFTIDHPLEELRRAVPDLDCLCRCRAGAARRSSPASEGHSTARAWASITYVNRANTAAGPAGTRNLRPSCDIKLSHRGRRDSAVALKFIRKPRNRQRSHDRWSFWGTMRDASALSAATERLAMATKALSFDVGDYVVYPKHGVGRVVELQSTEIAGTQSRSLRAAVREGKDDPPRARQQGGQRSACASCRRTRR